MGLARINAEAEGTEETQDELTVTGRVMGTAEFMAPEQAHNTRHADERSDIYSLGCTLCYLLTGRSPYRGDSAISKIVAHMNEPIPSLRRIRPEIPKRLDAVFAKMIAKSPGERQQTMLEVVQDLQRCARKDEATVPIARPAAVGSEQPQDWLAESPSSAMDDPLAWLEPASAESPADVPPPETADLAETAAYRSVKKNPTPKSRRKKRPAPPPEPRKPAFSQPKLFLGGAAAAVALLLLVIVVLRFKTPAGTLVIEVDQPGADVSVDDEKITIAMAEAGKPVEIKVDEGEHTLRVSKDGFEVKTQEFTMKAGDREAIKVKLVPVAMAGTTKAKVQAAPTTTGENYALEFDGETSGVRIPRLDYDGIAPITIEALVVANDTDAGKLVCSNGSTDLQLYRGKWRVGHRIVEPVRCQYTLDSEAPAIKQQIVHVVAICANGRLRLYIDGEASRNPIRKLDAEEAQKMSFEELISGKPMYFRNAGFYLGRGDPNMPYVDEVFFHGLIDEVRISNIARYTDDFTPQKRFEPDEHTMALYHFDEGEGDVLHDSSGNKHHGKIVGAKWVKVDGSPITGRAAEPAPSLKQPTTEAPPLAIAPFDADQAKKHQQAWADYLGVPVERDIDLGDGVKLTMVLIPPGEFMMGSTEEEQKRFLEEAKASKDEWAIERIPSEGPQHRVRITKPFYLGRHEVTRGQFRQFVTQTQYATDAERDGRGGYGRVDGKWVQDPRFLWSTDPGFAQTDDDPVVNVSWNDATAFCVWLSKKQEEVQLVLPSEAQWEYACRAGTTTYWHSGDDRALLRQSAWSVDNSGDKTHPVGQLEASAWGLYDMHGNVREWCEDLYGKDYYGKSSTDDPQGPSSGSRRVSRGGCWGSSAWRCRSALRDRGYPSYRDYYLGFRLAAVPSSK